jgi:hypothetical protein
MSHTTVAKLEDLPSDGGRVVDVLAGANLRIFVRLNELEEQLKRLGRRVAALEGAGKANGTDMLGKSGHAALPRDPVAGRARDNGGG